MVLKKILSVISHNPKQTHQISQVFIKTILNIKRRLDKALVVILEGELGAGKTEFLKGVAKALKIKEKINSPTFVIFKRFKIKNKFFNYLWHFDLYRIKNIKELNVLGFKEIINDKRNLVFIEWGEKIEKYLKFDFYKIKIEILKEKERKIEIKKINSKS